MVDRGSSNSGTGSSEVGSSDGGAGGTGDANDSDERLWLVERTYTDKGLVSLVYATTDGEYALARQRSTNALRRGSGVTAAIAADPEDLDPVDDARTREQYADEAERMADRHDPDDAV